MSKLFHCTTDYLLLDEDEMDTDEEQNVSELNTVPTNQIFIESPLTKNLVSCFKVTVSPVLYPAKNQPKYLLLGVDKVTFIGEHTTQLGWYETEEDIQKEISEITSAIREGKNCYTLKYNVEVDIKTFSVEMKKAQSNDNHTKFPKIRICSNGSEENTIDEFFKRKLCKSPIELTQRSELSYYINSGISDTI